MLKNKYVPFILYLSVVTVYITSLKGLVGINKHSAKKEAVIQDTIRILVTFRPYFFTIWNFALQIFFLLTAIVDEASKLLELPLSVQKSAGRLRAFLFNTFVFPCTLLVITVFWLVWHIDRELIFPKVLNEIIPSWLNHILHTFIVVPIIIEIALPKKYNFVKFKNAAAVLVIYAVIYAFLYTSIYLRYGVWLYPICNLLNWVQMIVLAVTLAGTALAYQKIGIVLQNRKKMEQGIKIE